jgi:hypothetical protein
MGWWLEWDLARRWYSPQQANFDGGYCLQKVMRLLLREAVGSTPSVAEVSAAAAL